MSEMFLTDVQLNRMETETNISISDYLEQQLGPKHLSKDIVVPITIVYIAVFISGLLGNSCVCLVIIKKNSMQTATNYYLFSLAISDLLLLIFGLPNDLSVFWQQYPWILGEAMCRVRALISEMTNYASVLTIVAFTVERYVAICHPLLSQTTSSLPRVVKIIATNWLIAAVVAIPYAVLTSVHYIDYPPGSRNFIRESAFCQMSHDPKDNPHFRPLLCFSSLAFFFGPMTLIVILYIKIGITLRKSAFQHTECSSLHNEGKPSARKAIIRMLVAVVIAFIICWAPFHAQRLLFLYVEAGMWSESLRKLNEILYFAGCFYYLNATINPVLYNVMSVKYREAFCELLCETCPSHSLVKCALSKKMNRNHDNDTTIGGRRTSSMADTYTIFDDGGCNCDRSSVTLTLTTFDSDDSEKSNCNEPIIGKCNMLDSQIKTTSSASSSSSPFQSYKDQLHCLQLPKVSNQKCNQEPRKINLNLRENQLKISTSQPPLNSDSNKAATDSKSHNKSQIPSFNILHIEHETDL